ncbi:MAG: CoA transferase [Dehalococcoidia bacterium]|nr:CoA transferase [Dehalococcoidia bacterium]MDW8119035.1 CoA transferase [Chloroflexota bacterium]
MSTSPLPLADLRVLDIGTFIAAPVAGTLLAEFGAQVIKVEMPGTGDIARQAGELVNGTSLFWTVEGRNKQSITLDLRKPQGQALLKELVKISDILLENFRPGTLERWGLGWDNLRAVNPTLIMVRVSGFGQTGPYRYRAAYDRVAVGFGGLAYVTGFPDRPPTRPGFPLADYLTACFATIGCLIALRWREKTGQGQMLDLALYESILRVSEHTIPLYDRLGIVRERQGNVNPAGAPSDHFLTQDGKWVSLIVTTDDQFRRLAQAIGKDEWTTDPRFATLQGRRQHLTELNTQMAQWISQHTLQETLAILERAGVAAGPIYSAEDICADPHIRERGILVEVDDPVVGKVRIPGVTPRLTSTPGSVRQPAPTLGQHNQEIYCNLLGLSPQTLEGLQAEGVI